MRHLFAPLCLLTLLVALAAIWQESDREWKEYQETYYKLAAAMSSDPARSRQILETPLEIKQIQTKVDGRVDRCITCHLGVENPNFAGSAEPYATHPKQDRLGKVLGHSLDEFGCSLCHDGQGLATTKDAAHGSVPHWDRPLLTGKWVEIGCGRCHKGTLELEGAPVLSEGRRLAKQVGCYKCHKMEGFGDDGKRGGFGPDLGHTGVKMNEKWLQNWLRDPFASKARTKMPDFYLTDQEARALTRFLMTLKGREAENTDAQERTPDVTRGRELFGELKCFFCHNMKGFEKEEMAADLTGFGNKNALDLDFGHVRDTDGTLRDWTMRKLREPRAFRTEETTLHMPGNDLSEEQAAALTVLVLSFTGESVPRGYRREEQYGENEGQRLFEELSCIGCHNARSFGIIGANKENVAKDLSHIGDKVKVAWMIQWLKDPASSYPDTKMPALGSLTENQVLQLAGYVMSFRQGKGSGSFDPVAKEAEEAISLESILEGRKIFESMECYRCHRVAARGGSIAPDLSRAGEKLRREWLLRWLSEPENYNLNMLDDRSVVLSDSDITHLVDYLLSLRDGSLYPPEVPPTALILKEQPAQTLDSVERGRRLFGEAGPVQHLFGKRVGKMGLGCYGCHRLGDRGTDIGPDLSEEGEKVNRQWLLRWLKDPAFYVPDSKMGDFHLEDDEAEALTDFLMTFRGNGRSAALIRRRARAAVPGLSHGG